MNGLEMSEERTLFLAGDVMIGRGLDQALGHSVDPVIHERYVRDARTYVELAEETHGPVPAPLAPGDVWGDALDALRRTRPDARIVNLETALTTSGEPWPGKGIHYRSHPENVACLRAAGVECCVLANNHVLDWGRGGLAETLRTLSGADIETTGAGPSANAASDPAVLETGEGVRVLVFGLGASSSGIPRDWAATAERSGVRLLPDLSAGTLEAVLGTVDGVRREDDLIVVSIHWGPNWGYRIPDAHRRFARGLVDGGVDAVHGHSSHHPLGIEVYRERPILYGCGDFLNDYEGIGGRERFRGDLVLMYLPTLRVADGALARFRIRPFRIRRLRLETPGEDDVAWLRRRLDRESRPFGVRVERAGDAALSVEWRSGGGSPRAPSRES